MGGQQQGQHQDAPSTTDRLKQPAAGDSTQAALAHQLGDKEALNIIQGLNKNGAGDDQAMLKKLGLPSDPFSKEWTDPGEKGTDKAIHKIKEALGIHHTIEDKEREREVSRLTPDQKKAYDKEESDLKAYQTGMNLNAKRPDTPLHDQVEQKVSNFETQSKDKAVASLTPDERKQYDQEQKDQKDRFDQWLKNPMAPMPDEKPHPMQDKVDKLTQQNAEKDLQENPTGWPPGQGPHPGSGGFRIGGPKHDDPNADGKSHKWSDGSTTHIGAKPQDNYTEKNENGKNVKTYRNGAREETDQKTGAVDVHLPNGDSIHVAKNGDSTYTGSHATGGDGTKPVHHKSQDEALEQARQKYEFPPTPNHPRFGQIALGKPLPGEVARAIQDQPVDQTV